MSEENQEIIDQEKNEEKKCTLCISEPFRQFLCITFGTFIGVFAAMSLFVLLHKPPKCHMGDFPPPAQINFYHHKGHHINHHKHPPKDFKKDDIKGNHGKMKPDFKKAPDDMDD